jgi:hypothetical protein
MIELKPQDVERIVKALRPEVTQFIVANKAVLAGGFVRDVICGGTPGDVDLLVRSQGELSGAVVEEALGYWFGSFPRKQKSSKVWEVEGSGSRLPVQVIVVSDPKRVILERFDYTVCSCGVEADGKGWRGFGCDYFYEDLELRRLALLSKGSVSAKNALPRLIKLLGKGFKVDYRVLVDVVAASVSGSLNGKGILCKEAVIVSALEKLWGMDENECWYKTKISRLSGTDEEREEADAIRRTRTLVAEYEDRFVVDEEVPPPLRRQVWNGEVGGRARILDGATPVAPTTLQNRLQEALQDVPMFRETFAPTNFGQDTWVTTTTNATDGDALGDTL